MLPEQLQELRIYPQFVVWRYEANGAAKPAKVPYSPRTLQRASVTHPETWGTFDEAIAAASNFSGIGFVLSNSDPYSFIDLDVPPGEQPDEEQKAIYQNFNSYAERSPGGNGLHIIVRGKVPTGKRRGKVEVYSRQHYMTVTGNVFRPAPIIDCNAQLQTLWAQLGGEQRAAVIYSGAPQIENDEAVISRAANAANGDKFKALLEGRWTGHYKSPSEADLALVNMVAFYTRNREQIARIFRTSVLGQRPKLKRADYITRTVTKALDREITLVDVSPITQRIEEKVNASRNNSDGDFVFRFAKAGDDVVQIEYLINPWFPVSEVVGVYGRGSSGKSSWTATGCAIASRFASSIWITSEEQDSHIRQRHLSCGGEEHTLAVVVGVPTQFDLTTHKVVSTTFNVYEHLEPAILAFKANPEARTDRPLGIVVLDAVVALVTWNKSKGEHPNDDAGVKRLIAFLRGIAERHRVTILMLGHLNKSKHDHIEDSVAGALAWTTSVRLAYMFASDNEVEFQGFVRTIKTNTGTPYGAIYRTVPVYTLHARPDGKSNFLCGADMDTIIWGEISLREATGDEDESKQTKREQRNEKIGVIVTQTLELLNAGPTTRQVVEMRIGGKQNTRHWQQADVILTNVHGVLISRSEHNVYHYSCRSRGSDAVRPYTPLNA